MAADLIPAARRPYRVRFLVLYGVLAAVIAAAAFGVVVAFFGGGSSGSSGESWSSWRPGGSGTQAEAKEIAAHVAPAYRLPSGDQIVDVTARPPKVQDVSRNAGVDVREIRAQIGRGIESMQIDSGNSIFFTLCGLGDRCAIATGAATIERGWLVRREALELALYTFKYIDPIENVVAFMPPRKGQNPQHALFFRRIDLEAQLEHPLGQTLRPRPPLPLKRSIPPVERDVVDSLTLRRYFEFSYQVDQQGYPTLVLRPAL